MADKESKKRKRLSNGVDTQNKKVAFEGTNGRIKIIFNNENGLHPVLASSPGLTAPSIAFNAYARSSSTRHANNSLPQPDTHELLLHSQKHARLDYTASPIALDNDLSHYIAVFDLDTQQLQITPAHHLSLRSTLRTEADEDEEKKQRRTLGQQREELGREFGTKKAKKAIADKTVNAIVKDSKGKGQKDEVQDAILESMEDSAAAATNFKEEEALGESLASKPIPKPNLAAESVEDVYTFNTLIPPSDARLLNIKDWQEKTRNDEVIKLNYGFPAHRVAALGKSDDVLRLKALGYIHLLLEFNSALQNAGRSGKKVPKKDVLSRKLPSWPEPLVSSVRVRFSNTANELPQWHLQNLYTHICALSLFVDGWVTSTEDLKRDLRVETKELTQYFRELGCKVDKPTEKERERFGITKAMVASSRVAKLKLPLDFPKARVGRRK